MQPYLGAAVLFQLLHKPNREDRYYIKIGLLAYINIISVDSIYQICSNVEARKTLDIFSFVKNCNLSTHSFVLSFIHRSSLQQILTECSLVTMHNTVLRVIAPPQGHQRIQSMPTYDGQFLLSLMLCCILLRTLTEHHLSLASAKRPPP